MSCGGGYYRAELVWNSGLHELKIKLLLEECAMRSPALSRLVTIFLVLAFPFSTMMAETNTAAMLNASGSVAVNGASVGASSTAVYKGDSVTTSEGYAQITLPGTMISMRPNSRLTYQPNGLTFGAGKAMVSTSTGMITRAAQVSIKPASLQNTRYELNVVGNAVTLHSSVGAVVLEFAGSSYAVAEGSTVTFGTERGSSNAPPAATKSSSKKRKPAMWIWLGAGAGAAAVGIAAAAGGGNSSVSPSAP